MLNLPLNLSQALSGGHLIALPLALAGGVVAGMNPCCLALYPAAAGSCCSVSEQQTIRRSFGNAVAFVLGIVGLIQLLEDRYCCLGFGCFGAFDGDHTKSPIGGSTRETPGIFHDCVEHR